MHSAGWPASPQHQRAPSLGELHQELENEQEAQVVRTPLRGENAILIASCACRTAS